MGVNAVVNYTLSTVCDSCWYQTAYSRPGTVKQSESPQGAIRCAVWITAVFFGMLQATQGQKLPPVLCVQSSVACDEQVVQLSQSCLYAKFVA